MVSIVKIDVISEVSSLLGESPLWHPIENCLYWVDIVTASLYRFDPGTKHIEKFCLSSELGCIGWRAKGGLIAALRDRFVTIDTETGFEHVVSYPWKNKKNVMFNDGKCDRHGRFWAGTKDIQEKNSVAALYCLDTAGVSSEFLSNRFTVSNGIAWSLDNSRMYICDSPKRQIYQYDFDLATGRLGPCRVFAQVAANQGFPDGLTVDSEGYVWSCHWDGWQITRYSPQGVVDHVIAVPVPRPTSCCFGGPHLTTLYVTSASVGLSASALLEAPYSGQIFSISTGIKGLAEPPYEG